MADEHDGDELLLDNPIVDEQTEAEETVIEIEGEEAPAAEETDLVKHLRSVARDAQREAADLRKAHQPQIVEIGKKPDLWDDCEGDPERFEAALTEYSDRKRRAEDAERAQTQASQSQTQAFEKARMSYGAAALKMGVKDPDGVVQKVADTLSSPVAGFILQYVDNPAALMAALDTRPDLLAKIAAEPDQIRQMVLLTQMGSKVKVVTRKGPPPPEAETIQRGSAAISTNVEKTLKRLEDEADRTGDRSKFIRFQESLEKKA